MTGSKRRPRRRAPDLAGLTLDELDELTARLEVVRQALDSVRLPPAQAGDVLTRLKPLSMSLRAVCRRLDARARTELVEPDRPRCARCGRALPADNRPRRWCSQSCRQRAYEERRHDTSEASL